MRGGRLERTALRRDVVRYYTAYGSYGLSVFAVRATSLAEMAQHSPLARFAELTLIRVGVLVASGLRLEPTGRNPQHFTLAFDDLEAGIDSLLECEHTRWLNPYHED